MKKIILVNLFILFLIFLFFEIFLWNKYFKQEEDSVIIPKYSYRDDFRIVFDRTVFGTQYKNKSPILLLGCSYTYGHGLSEEDTFGAQLSQKTKRTVYNWGFLGDGPFQNILRLKEPYNQKLLVNGKPEYIIYTYMFDQTLRMSYLQDSLPYFLRTMYYARKENLIPRQKFIPFFDRFYTVQFIRDKLWNDYLFNHQKFDDINNFFDYLKFIFITMKKETDKLFPNSKFIILLYEDSMDDIYDLHRNFYEKLYSSERWKELEEYGIYVISTKDLVGFILSDKYMLENDFTDHPHPSKEAWKVIVPKLVKRFNL